MYFINLITTTILNIINRPVFCLKNNVSETGFCLRLPVEPAQLSPIDKPSLCFRRQDDGQYPELW
jgi:hypothetical protein